MVPAEARLLILRRIDLLKVSLVKSVKQTVNLQTTLLDRIDNSRDTPEVVNTSLHVQTSEGILLILRAELGESVGVLFANLAHGLEPDVENVEFVVRKRGLDTTARSVAAEDDVLDLEVLDAELDGGQEGDVGRVDDVCDVAQDEDLAGLLA